MRLWMLVLVAGYGLWFLQRYFAKQNGMYSPTDMLSRRNIRKGITFVTHGSTWWVLYCLIPLLTILVGLYGDQWSGQQWARALLFGLIISGAMHYMYTFAPYPDFMVEERQLSAAGWSHFVLFSGAIAILILTFLFNRGLTRTDEAILALTACYIVWHVFVGNHTLQKIFERQWHFPPYELSEPGPWIAIIGTALIMSGAYWFALSH